MLQRRVLLPFVLFLLSGMFLLAGTAIAQVTGPCTATIAGVDANQASTPQTAVEVSKDQSIAITVNGPDKFTSHKVMLEFAGIQWTVNEQTDNGKSWSDSVDVAKYAKYGVGLYKVIGVSTGNPCSGTAYVKVNGNALGTAAGAAAAGMTVLGGALVAASLVRGVRLPGRRLQSDGGTSTAPTDVPGSEEAATPQMPSPPVQPGPWFSITGLTGAILAGLGTLVLAQQLAIAYPTRNVAIIWMAAAIVLEVLLTMLARRLGIKKALAMAAEA